MMAHRADPLAPGRSWIRTRDLTHILIRNWIRIHKWSMALNGTLILTCPTTIFVSVSVITLVHSSVLQAPRKQRVIEAGGQVRVATPGFNDTSGIAATVARTTTLILVAAGNNV